MPNPPSSTDLRRWAAQCADQAKRVTSDTAQRERLLKMEQAFLAAADEIDRLARDPDQ